MGRVGWIQRYAKWLHTGWPAGTVEKLPAVDADFRTNVPGLYVVGDLTGVPLLKFAADSGAKAVRAIAAELAPLRPDPQARDRATPAAADSAVVHRHDVAIVGAGVSGVAAALEAQKLGLDVVVIDAVGAFATIADFPAQKPIFAYPPTMQPAGELRIEGATKEALLDELRRQAVAAGIVPLPYRAEKIDRRDRDTLAVCVADGPAILARRVIVAIGRSGHFRPLGVPGGDSPRVYHRLHDPADFANAHVLVVGGGDSALETALALADAKAASVTLSYRRPAFSRPKPDLVAAITARANAPNAPLKLLLDSRVTAISADSATATLALPTPNDGDKAGAATTTIRADAVFAMIGRDAPLDFFRRSGVTIRGDYSRARFWATLAVFVAFCVLLYSWQKGGAIDLKSAFAANGWFPFNVGAWIESFGGYIATTAADPTHIFGAFVGAAKEPSFYYSLLYCACVVLFGWRRIKRRQTPYVTRQTLALMAIQVGPLFVLPYLLLPWIGANGAFDGDGVGRFIGDEFFPEKSYWRSFGLILAWPLFVYNVFEQSPTGGWLVVSFLQTFVIIPLIVWKWGKGAYCGWICSCGALAETLGDAHRHKMPHGPFWNRLNMAGQVILALALAMLVVRGVGWIAPEGDVKSTANAVSQGLLYGHWDTDGDGHAEAVGWPFSLLNYWYFVDVFLAGILGIGLYFHFSGRVWCRFFCPLAALMHVYARFTRFRIFAEKSKCISCNVCTTVCHQGIDVMSFANKGLPMADPQCVRCSACVQSCPTGVLEFGEIDPRTGAKRHGSRLCASTVGRTDPTSPPTRPKD